MTGKESEGATQEGQQGMDVVVSVVAWRMKGVS